MCFNAGQYLEMIGLAGTGSPCLLGHIASAGKPSNVLVPCILGRILFSGYTEAAAFLCTYGILCSKCAALRSCHSSATFFVFATCALIGSLDFWNLLSLAGD